MKCLSVKQPWASLLVSKTKTIELRTWTTKHRGLLGIHASLKLDPYGPLDLYPNADLLPRGAVIGTVNLVDCRPMMPNDAEAAMHEWREGLFAWVVTEGSSFSQPVPMKGRLSLWEATMP